MKKNLCGLTALLTLAFLGCGRDSDYPPLIQVTGTVTVDGKPLPGAVLTFIPTGTTPGWGATGSTGEDGKYQLAPTRGHGAGIAVGEYRVFISKRVMPDGTDVAEDDKTPRLESQAQETLPNWLSHPQRTIIKATVKEGTNTIDFPLILSEPPPKRE